MPSKLAINMDMLLFTLILKSINRAEIIEALIAAAASPA